MRIVNIEIPSSLNGIKNQVQISGKQIQSSRYQIAYVAGKAQITFKFKMELNFTQATELESFTKREVPFLKGEATVSADIPGADGTIKAELSFDGSEYTLVGHL
jgi:hypothetical protein